MRRAAVNRKSPSPFLVLAPPYLARGHAAARANPLSARVRTATARPPRRRLCSPWVGPCRSAPSACLGAAAGDVCHRPYRRGVPPWPCHDGAARVRVLGPRPGLRLPGGRERAAATASPDCHGRTAALPACVRLGSAQTALTLPRPRVCMPQPRQSPCSPEARAPPPLSPRTATLTRRCCVVAAPTPRRRVRGVASPRCTHGRTHTPMTALDRMEAAPDLGDTDKRGPDVSD